MLLTQKYVIISITYLTKSELPWGKVSQDRNSFGFTCQEDGDGHRPKTQPPTPFSTTQATWPLTSPISKYPTTKAGQNNALRGKKAPFYWPKTTRFDAPSGEHHRQGVVHA